MERTLRIILAILLLLCLADMPYGYYQLVRFVSMAGFIYLAYKANENNNTTQAVAFVLLALLFQPFAKIALGRSLWNIVDVVVAVWLLTSLNNTGQKGDE